MRKRPTNDTEASRHISEAVKLFNRGYAAKLRAAWRTPGTKTHLKETEKGNEYRERAEAILEGVQQYLEGAI